VPSEDWGEWTRRGILWSNVAFVATRALGALTLLVLARLLTPSTFGVVAAITVYVFVVELISDAGMRNTVVYEQEHAVTRRVDTAFTMNVGLALGLTAIAVLAAPLVADFFRLPEETDLFRLAALNPLIKSLGNIHDALMLRDLAFRRRALPELVLALTRAGVSIPLAVAGLGATSIVVGLLAGTAAWVVAEWVLTGYRPRPHFDRAVARSMIGYGGAASLVDIIAALASRIDVAVIARVLGDRALGLYTVAFRIPELLVESVAWNTHAVAFPALSRKRRDDAAGLADATRGILRYQALYAVPVSALLAVVGTPLVVVLFSEEWRGAGGVASAVAVMAGISALVFPLGDVFKALGRQRVFILLQLVYIPLVVGAVVAAAPAGIVAVAWARVGTRAFWALLLGGAVTRTLRASPLSFLRETVPALVAGAGVVAGAGSVRLLWPDASLLPLVAEIAAGLACGVLALRVAQPAAYSELRAIGGMARARVRRGAGPPAATPLERLERTGEAP
jgi:O-antigen/teichoic acid export membrane protein